MKKFLTAKPDSFQGKEFKINRRRVTVEEVIAEGGFSLVFLVYCESENSHYALKRMFVNEEDKLKLCQQEIEIARKLSGHKNIVECVDASITTVSNDVNEVLILLQYYKTSILDEMNERMNRRFTEPEVMKIFCDVCEAVACLHYNLPPIIHRDLKKRILCRHASVSKTHVMRSCVMHAFVSLHVEGQTRACLQIENLLRDNSGNIRLCDFGSATFQVLDPRIHGVNKVNDELQKYTTLQYRSPEMVDLYSNNSISYKSDIWALGCLLYRLCFFSNCFGDSIMTISNGQFTVPDNCIYSDGLLKLIKYMLQVDPNDRPDIYQVSCLAFLLANRSQCPVPNFNMSKVPDIEKLPKPKMESEEKSARIKSVSRNFNQSEKSLGTSINPRERPRVQTTNRMQATDALPSKTHSQQTSVATSNPDKLIELEAPPTKQMTSSQQGTPGSTNQLDPFGLPPMNITTNMTSSSSSSSSIFFNNSTTPYYPTTATNSATTIPTATTTNHMTTPTIPEELPLIDLNTSNGFENSFLTSATTPTNHNNIINPFKQHIMLPQSHLQQPHLQQLHLHQQQQLQQQQQQLLQHQPSNASSYLSTSFSSNPISLNQYIPQAIPQYRYYPTCQSYSMTPPTMMYNQPMRMGYANNRVANNSSMVNINMLMNHRPDNSMNNNKLQNLNSNNDNNFNHLNIQQQQQPMLYKHRRNVSDTSALLSNYHSQQQLPQLQHQQLQQQQQLLQHQQQFQQQVLPPQLQHLQTQQQPPPSNPTTGSLMDVMRTSFSCQATLQPQQQQQQHNVEQSTLPDETIKSQARDSLLDQFDELTLRHSHSFSTIDQQLPQTSAIQQNISKQFQSNFQHQQHSNSQQNLTQCFATRQQSTSTTVATNDNHNNKVDAFGEIPFHKMVTNLKTRHQQHLEMGHKRSVSDFK